jgi:hypothetical protein
LGFGLWVLGFGFGALGFGFWVLGVNSMISTNGVAWGGVWGIFF